MSDPGPGACGPKRRLCAGVTLGLCLVLAGCSEKGAAPAAPPARPPGPPVTVARVQRQAFPLVYPVGGTVVPREQVEVASRVSGFVQEVAVREGERVEPGALLVAIDDAAVEASVRAAEAAVMSARADLDEASGDVERFRRLARTRALAEDELRKAEVRVARAEAARVRAEAELTTRRQDRQYARIVSPAPAQVRERLRDPGDLVTAGDPILRLDVLGPLELEVFVPSSLAGALAVGQSVRVGLEDAEPGLTGHIAAVVHSADAATRRCKVRVALPEHAGLIPGRFARALFVLGEQSVLALPASALTERAGIPGVFVVEPSGTVRFLSVQPGRAWGDLREVLAGGVEVGTTVVSHPPAVLRDGDRALVRASPDEP